MNLIDRLTICYGLRKRVGSCGDLPLDWCIVLLVSSLRSGVGPR